mmetsp:Transcript_75832/g.190779  ORF Transcript_75832/g.190779 Transcript_75832/m.190779 type:complete len:257 (+) Transcript_75832:1432-2202(+)
MTSLRDHSMAVNLESNDMFISCTFRPSLSSRALVHSSSIAGKFPRAPSAEPASAELARAAGSAVSCVSCSRARLCTNSRKPARSRETVFAPSTSAWRSGKIRSLISPTLAMDSESNRSCAASFAPNESSNWFNASSTACLWRCSTTPDRSSTIFWIELSILRQRSFQVFSKARMTAKPVPRSSNFSTRRSCSLVASATLCLSLFIRASSASVLEAAIVDAPDCVAAESCCSLNLDSAPETDAAKDRARSSDTTSLA